MRGLDFRIAKTSKGGYADYNTSKWSRKETALTEVEQAALVAHGLFTLGDFLPKRPTEVELKVMKQMFEASVDGQSYDTERWGQYFRPAGVSAPAASAAGSAVQEAVAAPAVAAKSAPVASSFDEDEPAVEPVAKPAGGGQNAQDILAMIRARQTKQ
jgi:hypothetical protein